MRDEFNSAKSLAERAWRSIPQGVICKWTNGEKIPEGWTLCDGKKGKHDLRERFTDEFFYVEKL